MPATPLAEPALDNPRFYRGSSMLGTFRPGDYLTLENVPLAEIRVGDVVVFRGVNAEGEVDSVVHRVVGVLPGGLVTRGDNNARVDTTLLTAERLVGRVTHLERNGHWRRVYGGPWGQRRLGLRRRGRWLLWHARRLIRAVGRWPYRLLRRCGLVPRLWRPAVIRLRLAAGEGMMIKYVAGGRTVARCWPESGRFQCRKPYDLVIARPEERES